ncbi:hypothetical protein BH10BAC3_BH10BAC3_26220 [soil metagenome]
MRLYYIYKILAMGIISLAFCFSAASRCFSAAEIWQVLSSDASSNKTILEKLQNANRLLVQFENCKIKKDSVYVRLLDRIGLYEYLANKNITDAFKNALRSVETAAQIKTGNSNFVTAVAYKNIAYYYRESFSYNAALNYFDTAIIYAGKITGGTSISLDARKMRCLLFFQMGDYQKSNDESSLGLIEAINSRSVDFIPFFYNRRAQAYNYQNQLKLAITDIDSASINAKKYNDVFEIATALKSKAIILDKQQRFDEADFLFNQAINERKKTGDLAQLADDYTDYGNFLISSFEKYKKGILYYSNSEILGRQLGDSDLVAKAYTNIGQVFFRLGEYGKAKQSYTDALRSLKANDVKNFNDNISASQLNQIINKDLLLVLLGNKTELLVQLYRQTNEQAWLQGALETARVTDSVITGMRHEQTGEQSKLYWRDKTREFYTNAIEACWLAKNNALAFFFMEKSRAVLLNDKLNELGAQLHLPAIDAAREQALQINILTQQQRLNTIDNDPAAYSTQQLRILEAKAEQEHFVKSMEQKYPVYYQYKYADDVPSLSSLQKFLGGNNQQFIQYFINDTIVYFLAITAGDCRFHKLTQNEFSIEQLKEFSVFCADKNLLNTRYPEFTSLSNNIYYKLFKPANIVKGRVIICPDNYLIPFEALSSTADGEHFLIEDYAFSYVYSAGFLLKKYPANQQDGNFLGIAPGIFAKNLKVPELKNSTTAIRTSSGYFSGVNLFTGIAASRKNFITYLPNYAVVNIFSHAYADSTDEEPLLYMQDSVIGLSELDLINNPAAQLVILSACQTNVGKNATGEGIYSIARGFASVGVPAVASTLWKADEESIYAITALFNENLSKGVSKDVALQKAKIDFIRRNDNNKLLPFYWANMILVGSAEPVNLSKKNPVRYIILFAGFSAIVFTFIFLRRKKVTKNN